ncbi:hypothetical protein [Sulfitobacter sp. PS-8MA]
MMDKEKSVVAAGTRNDAQNTNEAGQLRANDTALMAERHPIIALHWGIAS